MKRNHILDILRMVAIFMIVMHHLTITDIGMQDVLKSGVMAISYKQLYFSIFVNAFCIIGVNLFFMLSGYFGIKFKVKKLISIIIQIFIIHNIIAVTGLLTGRVLLNKDTIIHLLNPVDNYWFIIV